MFLNYYNLEDLNIKLKPFDLNSIGNLERNHPIIKQEAMMKVV